MLINQQSEEEDDHQQAGKNAESDDGF